MQRLVVLAAALASCALCAVVEPRPFLGRASAMTRDEMTTYPREVIADGIVQGSLSMSVYPPVIDNGQDAYVSYSGVPNPTPSDYLTVSCGPTNGLGDYMDKVAASINGTAVFPNLILMRCNYTFTYISMATGSPVALDSVIGVMAGSLGTPMQGHISFTDNDDEMMVIYTTGTTNTPSVRFGSEPNNLDMVVNGTTSTYGASNLCNYPANETAQVWFRDPGYIHRVLLSGLEYATVYYYQFGNDVDGWSQQYSFLSKPEPGTKNVNFICYADMGTWNYSPTTVAVNAQVDNGFNAFLIHHGDIAYALGTAYVWGQYMNMIETYATRIPYMVGIGNHEYDFIAGGQNDPSHAGGDGFHPSWGNYGDDSAGECGVPTVARFSSPTNGNGLFWYSFDYGNVHVLMFSTEHNWTRGSDQYNWIQQDLASVNKTITPWIVMAGHRMMYTTQMPRGSDFPVSIQMRAEVEPLLYQYGVNLYFDGHQHSFERSCNVYRNVCLSDGTGTVFVTVGTAGASLEAGGFSNTLGNWSVAHTEQFGFTLVQVTEATMTVQFMLDADQSIYDEVTLYPWPQTREREERIAQIQRELGSY